MIFTESDKPCSMHFIQFRKGATALLIAFVVSLQASGQAKDPPFFNYCHHPWVDSVLNSLSVSEKIAQLIWVAAFAEGDLQHEAWLNKQVTENKAGGVIFFNGKAGRQAEMINYYRKVSEVPLIYATDGEWGLGMRLAGVEKFPFQLTLGAIRNDSLIYRMGSAVAEQFIKAGININLAPVADVNNNPSNPVISVRSFGEDPVNVRSKTLMYMKSMQDHGIIAVAKHFPGHGDTEVDSHFDLPVIKHSKERLDSVELVPFRALINSGVTGIMPGHLSILSMDSSRNLPSTLSHKILTQFLRNELNFKGLILSDAMNMGAVTKYAARGEAEVKALIAGVDVLEYVTDPALAIKAVMNSLKEGKLTEESLNEKCRKVLAAKYWAGLCKADSTGKIDPETDLSPASTSALIRELYASALTLLENDQNLIPLRNPEKIRIATVAVNSKATTPFQEGLGRYTPADTYFINPRDRKASASLLKTLEGYDLVIAGIYGLDQRTNSNSPILPEIDRLIGQLTASNKCIITWFGNPYSVSRVKSLEKADGLILAYQENNYTEDLSSQLIFGAIGARGSLPVTISERWRCGDGILTPGNIRLQYGLPESAGMSSEILETRIDSLVKTGIDSMAFPGCFVMAARKGIVVFSKAYGYQTYEKRTEIREDDLFDLASVTKVSATLPGLMVLETLGKFSTVQNLGEYLPFFDRSNKEDLKIADILTHQSGLTAWIPFWKQTVKKNGELKRSIFASCSSKRYPLQVADDLYIKAGYRKKILREIKKSPVSPVKKFLYSDLGFIIMPEIIERKTGIKWYSFVTDTIYRRIGAFDTGFNPLLRYPQSRIIPTEHDSLFRRQLLHGTVHDEGSAMLGGISGHAGLFSTGNDLMKLMELYRRMGSYGGEQIISKEVMEKYTSVQFPENSNRRGLGFDKPLLNNPTLSQKDAYPARSASASSFGHSGYTGTFVWVDPEYEISYIFLSNRVYPTRNNNKLSSMNIRSDILQAIYDSIIK